MIVTVTYDKSLQYLDSQRAALEAQVAEWLLDTFGEPCPEQSENCEVCQRWRAFARLFQRVT